MHRDGNTKPGKNVLFEVHEIYFLSCSMMVAQSLQVSKCYAKRSDIQMYYALFQRVLCIALKANASI